MKVHDLVVGVFLNTSNSGWYYWTSDAATINDVGGIPEGDSMGPYKSCKEAWQAAVDSRNRP